MKMPEPILWTALETVVEAWIARVAVTAAFSIVAGVLLY
jgi:hypothetical protein